MIGRCYRKIHHTVRNSNRYNLFVRFFKFTPTGRPTCKLLCSRWIVEPLVFETDVSEFRGISKAMSSFRPIESIDFGAPPKLACKKRKFYQISLVSPSKFSSQKANSQIRNARPKRFSFGGPQTDVPIRNKGKNYTSWNPSIGKSEKKLCIPKKILVFQLDRQNYYCIPSNL